MQIQIRPLQTDDIDAVLELSLLAWAPIFRSFERVLGPSIYAKVYPDWETSQRAAVDAVLRAVEKYTVWVAEDENAVVGFIAYTVDLTERVGEVYMLAVHPAHQNRGIGSELNAFALRQLKDSGMQLAVVGTGGDPGHAAARRSYEKAGYTALPLVYYYRDL